MSQVWQFWSSPTALFMEVPQMSAHFTDVWPLPGLEYSQIWFDLFAFDYMELDPLYRHTIQCTICKGFGQHTLDWRALATRIRFQCKCVAWLGSQPQLWVVKHGERLPLAKMHIVSKMPQLGGERHIAMGTDQSWCPNSQFYLAALREEANSGCYNGNFQLNLTPTSCSGIKLAVGSRVWQYPKF